MNDTTKVIAATQSANPAAGAAATTKTKAPRHRLTEGEREDMELEVGEMIENLEEQKPQVQDYEGYRATAHDALHGIIGAAAVEYKKYLTVFNSSAAKLEVKKQLKAKLKEKGLKTEEGEHTSNMFMKITFCSHEERIKTYARVLRAFAKTNKPASEFMAWIKEVGGIAGALKSGFKSGNKEAVNDTYYQAVTNDLVAGRATPIEYIKTNKIKGKYALVLAQRIDEDEYALIGSVDNLDDDAVPEVERFKQMIVSRKKAAKKAADAAAEKAEKKQA